MISKVLTANDIGATGGHQAGITVPKSLDMLNFFPVLDKETVNPSSQIRCTTCDGAEMIDLRYIYYNGKMHGTSTRNEYRITGLTKFFRDSQAKVGDELVFIRDSNEKFSIQIKKTSLDSNNKLDSDNTSKITLTGKWSHYRKGK